MKKKIVSWSSLRKVSAIGALCFMAACTSQYETRGNLPDDERLVEVVPGEVYARDVAEILGTPSTFSSFGGESWYYISERVERYAFYEPKLLERKVIRVDFDAKGLVSDVEIQDQLAGRKIQFVERETPTAGHSLTFFEQIFGNLGRFNKQ